jgi:hypothetical protein
MNIVLCDVCFHYDLLKAFSCSRNYLIITSRYLCLCDIKFTTFDAGSFIIFHLIFCIGKRMSDG